MVPIGIQYRYLKPSWKKLERLLSHLERLSGLTPPAAPKPSANRHCAQRICGLAHHLLAQMETFYGLPPLPSGVPFNARLERLLHTALQTAETYFGLSPQGDWNSRCRRIEEAAWTQIYREELRHPGSLAPLQRGCSTGKPSRPPSTCSTCAWWKAA